MSNCDCKEAFSKRTIGQDSRGGRIFEEKETPTGLGVHDCAYARRRNACIPLAEAAANQLPRRRDGSPNKLWLRTFLRSMDELAKEETA